MRLMIFRVVLTPTSPVIRTSSKLSKTSASTVVLPTTAFAKKTFFSFSQAGI
jgi:hypothetical protein